VSIGSQKAALGSVINNRAWSGTVVGRDQGKQPMGIHCVVFELHRERDEYRQFFNHLDKHQSVTVCNNCRLLFSRHSADAIKNYLQNFIYGNDVIFVAETNNDWALNRDYESTEWLRELEHLNQVREIPGPRH
jgi:hypothetical protein